MVIRRLLPLALLLLCLAATPLAAAPILYNINFTATSGSTPSGSFSYDSAAASNPFSGFIIVQSGVVFNYTFDANQSFLLSPSGASPCGVVSPSTLGTVFLALTTNCWPTRTWNSFLQTSSFLQDFTLFSDHMASGGGPKAIEASAGTFTVSQATPEPGTIGFMLSGLAVLAGICMRQRPQRPV